MQSTILIGIAVVVIIIIAAAYFVVSGSHGTQPVASTTTVGQSVSTNTTTATTTVANLTTTAPASNSTTATTTVANALPTTTISELANKVTFYLNETEWNFTPSNLSVANNTTVTFMVHNNGNYEHTFTLQNPSGSNVLIDTGYISPGGNATAIYSFTMTGNYTYYSSAPKDELHNLKGYIIVT